MFFQNVSGTSLRRRYINYLGYTRVTVSGKTCQRWDSQAPHRHSFTNSSHFPDASLQAAANYCRNPDETRTGPWCYTTDPYTPREACPIKPCECKRTKMGKEYAGRISRTQGGRNCQRWDTRSPHWHGTSARSLPDNSLSDAQNFCRNPNNRAKGPWCYTADPVERWDFCRIPYCPNDTIPSNCTGSPEISNSDSASPGSGVLHVSYVQVHVQMAADVTTMQPFHQQTTSAFRSGASESARVIGGAEANTMPGNVGAALSSLCLLGLIIGVVGIIKKKKRTQVHFEDNHFQ